ncbi:MAG: ABC transporter ATP-binding protein [Roseiflexaceae bacterium]
MEAVLTEKLTRRFQQRIAVDQLSLSIPQGSVFGFLGPNGAGKTTTVRMLCALIAPTSGTAIINGFPLGQSNTDIRRSVGLLTETPALYDQLSAWQNLIFFAQLYDLDRYTAEKQTQHYLDRFGLWQRRHDRVGSFSKGMRQKLAIARALLHNPKLIFLDEPTAGLDPEASRIVRDFINELRSEKRTIFLTTHNLNEADILCDQIGLFRTTLIRVGSPQSLRSEAEIGISIRFTEPAEQWINAISTIEGIRQISATEDTLSITLTNPTQQNPIIIKVLVAAGASLCYVEPLHHSLESIYLDLVRTNPPIHNTQEE